MVPKLTNNGYSLMIEAISGNGLQFSKIKIGNGEAPENFASLVDLQNPLVEIGIDEITRSDKYVILRGTMSNANFADGFYWTEIGIFARPADADEETEDVLYAYAYYSMTDEAPTYIPAYNSNLVEITQRIYVYIGDIEDVTAILSASSQYATLASLEEHIKNEDNPHGVTAEQVGLGKVQNAAPEDMTAAFTETALSSVTNITSGERFGSILQKIRTAIASLISHLSATNPHKITAAGIGAAATSHTHAASAITSGTLGLSRGGTGGSTAAAARANLSVYSKSEVNSLLGNLYSKSISCSTSITGPCYCHIHTSIIPIAAGGSYGAFMGMIRISSNLILFCVNCSSITKSYQTSVITSVALIGSANTIAAKVDSNGYLILRVTNSSSSTVGFSAEYISLRSNVSITSYAWNNSTSSG